MSLTAAVTSFGAVLPAELPDKTVLACLILSSRYRPGFVFTGAAAAFAVGAVLLWRHSGDNGDDAGEDVGRDGVRDGFWPVAAMSFAVVFLAEFGDLTQFMTVSLAARYHDPVAVGIGATLALWVAAGAAIVVGWRLLKVIPVKWLTRGAAIIMLILAATSAAAAAS